MLVLKDLLSKDQQFHQMVRILTKQEVKTDLFATEKINSHFFTGLGGKKYVFFTNHAIKFNDENKFFISKVIPRSMQMPHAANNKRKGIPDQTVRTLEDFIFAYCVGRIPVYDEAFVMIRLLALKEKCRQLPVMGVYS